MGKKRKLRKWMKRRGRQGRAVVVCVGKKCAPREASSLLLRELRAHAAATGAPVAIEAAGCLHVCKKGPIVATFPELEFHKRVDVETARAILDREAER